MELKLKDNANVIIIKEHTLFRVSQNFSNQKIRFLSAASLSRGVYNWIVASTFRDIFLSYPYLAWRARIIRCHLISSHEQIPLGGAKGLKISGLAREFGSGMRGYPARLSWAARGSSDRGSGYAVLTCPPHWAFRAGTRVTPKSFSSGYDSLWYSETTQQRTVCSEILGRREPEIDTTTCAHARSPLGNGWYSVRGRLNP